MTSAVVAAIFVFIAYVSIRVGYEMITKCQHDWETVRVVERSKIESEVLSTMGSRYNRPSTEGRAISDRVCLKCYCVSLRIDEYRIKFTYEQKRLQERRLKAKEIYERVT